MHTTLAILCTVIAGLLSAPAALAQQPTAHHTVVVKSKIFTASELNQLSQNLQSNHQFDVRGGCESEGLIVVDIPVSLSIRVNHAEEIIVSAIESAWSEPATIEKTVSVQEVMQCEQ